MVSEKLSLRLDSRLHDALKGVAERENKTISDVMTAAVHDFLFLEFSQSLRSYLESEITNLKDGLETKIEEVESQFEEKVRELEGRIDTFEETIDNLENKIEEMEYQFDEKVRELEGRIDTFEVIVSED